MRGFQFGKVFIVTHAKSFFLAASPLVTSAFGQRSVGLQPTPKHPAARKKNPLVTRARFNTTVFQYLVFYSGHEDCNHTFVINVSDAIVNPRDLRITLSLAQ